MKKLFAGFMVVGALIAGSNASAESIWNKGVAARYDYTKYATYLATQLKIDFGVWPLAWGHYTGSVHTDDGWKKVIWTNGQWEKNIQGPFGGWDESWTVYISGTGPNGQYMGQKLTPYTIEYALYVKNASGQWFWDNNSGLNYKYFVK